jgi:hypothetical protein
LGRIICRDCTTDNIFLMLMLSISRYLWCLRRKRASIISFATGKNGILCNAKHGRQYTVIHIACTNNFASHTISCRFFLSLYFGNRGNGG